MYTLEQIQEFHKKLPPMLFEQGYNKQFPFASDKGNGSGNWAFRQFFFCQHKNQLLIWI